MLIRLLAIFIVFAGISIQHTYAQTTGPQRIWQLSGLTLNKKTSEPIAYTKVVINRGSRRGILANHEGFYSIPVVEGDTVIFMRLGYKPSFLLVTEYLDNYEGDKKSPYIYAINYLVEDPITLPTVNIFPYDTPEKLKTAMLAVNIDRFSDHKFAQDNLDPALINEYIENMEIDDEERVLVARQVYANYHQSKNIAPVMPLFDPIAVYRLLKHISDNIKTKRNKDLNYWE